MFHPLQFISGFLFNLYSIVLISVNIYFVREWYYHKDNWQDENYVKWCLAFIGLSFLFTFFGKFFWSLILGKNGQDETNMTRSNETKVLDRPDGHQIFLEFYGNPSLQPLIFIHGWSSDSTQWYYVKKHLVKNYRVILMDLPGSGLSTKKTQPNEYSPESFAIDLDAVIENLGGIKPIVLGHSIGGMTILSYCKIMGKELFDKVKGLVLIETTYTNPVKTSLFANLLTLLEKPLLRPLCHLMIWFAPLLQLSNWLKFFNGSLHLSNHFTGFAGTETKGQLNLTSFLTAKAPVDVIARGMLGMFNYDATNILSQIDVPVLILAGSKDIMCKPEASYFMQKNIPNSKLEILEPSGHLGVLERNEQMTDYVEKFVQNIVKA